MTQIKKLITEFYTCFRCSGTGLHRSLVCYICNGEGRIPTGKSYIVEDYIVFGEDDDK